MMTDTAIKLFVLLAVAVIGVYSIRETPAPLYEHEPKDRVEGVYIAKIEKSCDADCFNDLVDKFTEKAASQGYEVSVTHKMAMMKMFTARMPKEAVEILRWMDNVAYIEEDQIITIDDGDEMGAGVVGF